MQNSSRMMEASEVLCAQAELDVQNNITWYASQRKGVYTAELREVVVEEIWDAFRSIEVGKAVVCTKLWPR